MNEDSAKKTILIIDDEEELLLSLQRPLKTKYTVVMTNRSVDVMNMLKLEHVNCVLLDIRMPGMTGIELLKEIKFTYPHLPILIMTGHGGEHDAVTALKYGAAGFIKKPIDIYVLFDEIERVTSMQNMAFDDNKPANILIVDDEVEFLRAVEIALAKYPFQIKSTVSVDEALHLIEKNNFDIVIVDVIMPKMTGLQFIEQAKILNSELVFIVITGNSSQDLAIESIKQGVFDYIRKPLEIGELVSSIERSMHKLLVNREITLKNKELLSKEYTLQKLNDEIILQKNFLENIVKSISNMLIITDKEGCITSVNDSTLKILGYKANELIGKPLKTIVPIENFSKFIKELIVNKGLSNLEKQYITKVKQKIFVLFSGSLIRHSDGSIEGFVFVAQDVSKHKIAEEKLHQLSYYDILTKLPNRLYFEISAKQTILKALADNAQLAFLYLDLDGFKAVNDRLGHTFGDILLQEVAKRLQAFFRANDFVARIGGDEFVAVLSRINDKSDAGLVAQRLINTINRPYNIENNEIIVGTSIGISVFPDSGSDFNQLFKNADVALYKAKHAGRNQYQYYTRQLDLQYTQQLKLDNALRFAIVRQELYMVYQPILSLKTKEIAAMEALIRWDSEELGNILPDIFIPIAEYNGLIIPIGEYVLDTVFKQYAVWKKQYHIQFKMSVNISSYQLDKENYLIDLLTRLCFQNSILPTDIELELTETAIMNNPVQAEKILTELHESGFIIVIDDFGQGYSSLSLLSRLPVSILKIDKEFVLNLDDKRNEFIIHAIVHLSKTLGLCVIAEGIEHEHQLACLTQIGCELGQGYLFSYPKKAKDLTAYL